MNLLRQLAAIAALGLLPLAACGPMLGAGSGDASVGPAGDAAPVAEEGGSADGDDTYPAAGGYGDSGGYPAPGDGDDDAAAPEVFRADGGIVAVDATTTGGLGALGVATFLEAGTGG